MTPHIIRLAEAVTITPRTDIEVVRLVEAVKALAPDLAHTEDEQAETIQTLSRLLAGAEEAATERAAQIERVRHALDGIAREKADSEYARGHDDDAEWYVATADALEYVIDLLTEALEGDNE